MSSPLTSLIRPSIMRLDLSNVRSHMQYKHELSDAELDELELAFKMYMEMMLQNPGRNIAVSEQLDEFLHTFLLFTEDAEAFYRTHSGRLFHLPVTSEEDRLSLSDNYHSTTLPMGREMFGDRFDRTLWPDNGMICLCNWTPTIPKATHSTF